MAYVYISLPPKETPVGSTGGSGPEANPARSKAASLYEGGDEI